MSCSFRNITVYRRFIKLQASSALLTLTDIDTLQAFSITPVCLASKSSSLTVTRSSWKHIRSREQGLMQLIDSQLRLNSVQISDFNVTFAYMIRANFEIWNSSVANGGLAYMDKGSKAKVTAGLIDSVDSSGVVTNSRFTAISGTKGGAIAATSKSLFSRLIVNNSRFEQCYAAQDGGVIYALGVSVLITGSIFHNNTAIRGGCVYFDCNNTLKCGCSLSNTRFSLNSATEGGVIRWTKVRGSYDSLYLLQNTAFYGNFEASIGTHMGLINGNNGNMQGVAGVVVPEPILIGVFDAIEQLVGNDNSSSVELVSSQLIGTTFLLTANGIANFSSVIVHSQPSSIVPIPIFSLSIHHSFPSSPASNSTIFYSTRPCKPGEVTSSQGCYPCPKETFSVNPKDQECRACPGYAVCPGGALLILEKGYWRRSENDSEVFICPIRSACLGGQQSECEAGYRDKLCAKCDQDYYSLGTSYCFQCEHPAIRVIRLLLVLSAILLLHLCVAYRLQGLACSSASDLETAAGKIVISLLQGAMLISLINVNWRLMLSRLLSVLEMMASCGITALNLECIWSKTHADPMSHVYVNAILASMLPLAGLAVIWLLYLFRKCILGRRNGWITAANVSFLHIEITQIYVIKTIMQLVTCRQVSEHTYWLSSDVEEQCWVGLHLKLCYLLFIPAFIIYALAVSALIAGAVYRFRRENYSEYALYLTIGLEKGKETYEIITTFRKIVLTLLLTLPSSLEFTLHNLTALTILFLCLQHFLHTPPYVHRYLNTLEALSELLQIVLIGCSFYFRADLDLTPMLLEVLGGVVFGLIVGWVIAGGIVMYKLARIRKAQITIEESGIVPPLPSVNVSSEGFLEEPKPNA